MEQQQQTNKQIFISHRKKILLLSFFLFTNRFVMKNGKKMVSYELYPQVVVKVFKLISLKLEHLQFNRLDQNKILYEKINTIVANWR